MRNTKPNSNTRRSCGFSAIELIITATVLTIVTGAGLMGITRARAHVRISGAAREYATYVEKARTHSIRSHADTAAERAAIEINDDRTSYDVIMDVDGDGLMDSRTIALPEGVSFDSVETIAFDWRGRTWNTVGAITTANAQVSIRLQDGTNSISIDVTGSGDITINSQVFDDSVPNVTLNVGDLTSGATPVPTPDETIPVATPTPTPEGPTNPDDSANPLPTPPVSVPTPPVPTPTPASGGNPHATPTPTPTPTPAPTPTPVVPCILSVDLPTVTLKLDGTATIKVSHNGSTSLSITGSSSKPSDLQVSGGAQSVAPGGSATFTIKSKRAIGVYSVTFSTGCGTKIVPVVVVALL